MMMMMCRAERPFLMLVLSDTRTLASSQWCLPGMLVVGLSHSRNCGLFSHDVSTGPWFNRGSRASKKEKKMTLESKTILYPESLNALR